MLQGELTSMGTIKRIEGPLLFLQRNVNVGLNDAVVVIDENQHHRPARITALDDDSMVVEVLETTSGLSLSNTTIRFHGETLHFGLGPDILGRVLDGVGRPIDHGPQISSHKRLRIDGMAMNPVARETPKNFIETGFSSIDLMNSLVRGQKLPIFSGGGLPHDTIAAEIAQRAKCLGSDANDFVVIFVAIGVSYETADYFRTAMEQSGALQHTVMFLNLASDSSTQRLLTPRYALTAAEYLAFEEERHVLVVMTDMTNYCEALREVSASHGEIPGRKGYPGYMYSDLASIYERAGCIKGCRGSLTQVPILTMPSDDITHPIPDLTGYITEGQIVLDRELHRHDIYPPIKLLPSLSRLMKDGIGEGFTSADHPALSNQLYTAYSRAIHVRVLARVMGADGLSEIDGLLLEFGDKFEQDFVAQKHRRSLAESMDAAWQCLKILPTSELNRLNEMQIETFINSPDRQ